MYNLSVYINWTTTLISRKCNAKHYIQYTVHYKQVFIHDPEFYLATLTPAAVPHIRYSLQIGC